MTYTLTIQGSTPEQMLTAINALNGAGFESVPLPAPKVETAKVDTPAAAIPAATVNEGKLTLERVREIVQPIATGGKKEAVKKVLQEFEATKVTDLKPEQYQAFVDKIKAL